MPDATALKMTDTLNRQGPALSATSDMPVIDITKAQPVEPKTEEPPKVEAKTEEPKAEDEGKPDETPAWMKREITIERNKRRAAEQAAADAQARLDQALQALPKAQTPKDQEADDPKPEKSAFSEPEEYVEALVEWSARSAARKARQEAMQEERERAMREAAEQTRKGWTERRQKAIAETPDWVEVAESPDVRISAAMASVITEAPNGPQIAYYLGKHPDIASGIASMSPAQAIFAMGQLASDLKSSSKPNVSKAPEPPTPIRGSRADALRKGPHEESMEEYAARRSAELRGKART